MPIEPVSVGEKINNNRDTVDRVIRITMHYRQGTFTIVQLLRSGGKWFLQDEGKWFYGGGINCGGGIFPLPEITDDNVEAYAEKLKATYQSD